jgi:hypothetical protein
MSVFGTILFYVSVNLAPCKNYSLLQVIGRLPFVLSSSSRNRSNRRDIRWVRSSVSGIWIDQTERQYPQRRPRPRFAPSLGTPCNFLRLQFRSAPCNAFVAVDVRHCIKELGCDNGRKDSPAARWLYAAAHYCQCALQLLPGAHRRRMRVSCCRILPRHRRFPSLIAQLHLGRNSVHPCLRATTRTRSKSKPL